MIVMIMKNSKDSVIEKVVVYLYRCPSASESG